MTADELVGILHKILKRRTSYNNVYPYNVGRYNEDGTLSFDCWCMVKAICWEPTIADNYTVGHHAGYHPENGLGDWRGIDILKHCTEISYDMTNIPVGAFMLYYDDSHAGVYIGNRQIVECTTCWGANGVTVSIIENDGKRTKEGVPFGRWYAWGKLPFVQYEESYPMWKKDDLVVLKENSRVYGKDFGFASWVYGTKLTVSEQSGDRVVIFHKGVIVGACYANDLEPWVEPKVEEPIIEEPPIVEEPVEEPVAEVPPVETKPTVLELILKTIQAIIEFLTKVFKNDN